MTSQSWHEIHDITFMTIKTKTEHFLYLIRQWALLSDNNATNGRFNATTVSMVMFTCVCLDSPYIMLCAWCYFTFVFLWMFKLFEYEYSKISSHHCYHLNSYFKCHVINVMYINTVLINVIITSLQEGHSKLFNKHHKKDY
jgi:hypothetical protein